MAQELFDDLYRLLRGSQAATALVEAKSLHAEEKFGDCVTLLERTLERYAQSREATLSKDLSHVEAVQPGKLDKETKRLVRKQGKANDALEQFQELIEKVRRNVRRTAATHKPASDATLPLTTAKLESTIGVPLQPPELVEMNALREQFAQGTTFAQKQEAIEYASKLSIQQRDQILDAGAFSQLIDAAQRSGIVPGIALIIQVRDCEFRLGKYHQALQLIESLLSAFVGSATQRTQRLKREEQDIASGRVKMSPKDMQAKRARDNKESELIERTRTRFTRVLEGIRAIIHLENEKETGGVSKSL